MFTLRPYTPADAPALARLFRDTIRRVNIRDYSAEQVRAWAPDDLDAERWATRFAGRFVVVAEADGKPVGFAEMEVDGHIDRFYVSADHQGVGVGRALMAAVLAEAERRGLPRAFAEVSVTARPFFERSGFVVLAEQTVHVRGVNLTNFRMERVQDEV